MNFFYDENNIEHFSLPQVLNLGAGVQSSTTALMAAHGLITPMPVAAVFADTQAEPASVYQWLEWLEQQLPFPVKRITAGSLTEEITRIRVSAKTGILYRRSGIPAFKLLKDGSETIAPRQCTYEFKVLPLDRAVKKLAGVPRGSKKLGAVSWMGISLDEVHRMKTPRHPWQLFRYPLVDMRMRRSDCLEWMRKEGYPQPPRSACVYCPYHSDQEWRRLRDEEPEAFKEAVRVDKLYRETVLKCDKSQSAPYLHPSRVPLDEVDFSQDTDHGQQLLFGNECTGMCGV